MNRFKRFFRRITERAIPFPGQSRQAGSTRQEALVGFLGIGAQKSGTSALDNYLRQHPEICLPEGKEIHFFDNEDKFRSPQMDYARYHAFFDLTPGHRIAGEVTPAYMYWDGALRRIWEYNPRMKLLILLRNPIQRAYSHWNMNRAKGFETLSFLEAVEQEGERFQATLPYQNKKYAYLERGFYSCQLRRVFRFFPRGQALIMKSSSLAQDPVNTMKSIFLFLGVEPLSVEEEEPVFQGVYKTQMTGEELAFLKDHYYYEIKELEQMLGWDCADWLA